MASAWLVGLGKALHHSYIVNRMRYENGKEPDLMCALHPINEANRCVSGIF